MSVTKLDHSTQLAAGDPEVATRRAVSAAVIMGSLLAYLIVGGLLLLRFLGVASNVVLGPAAAACGLVCFIAAKPVAGVIPARRITGCMLIAAVVLLLGGEGHVFYANVDWQVRDAVLADMIRWPWPFAYAGADGESMLRAPIGMYLVPALIGKAAGIKAAHLTLLAQNALVLGSLFALGSLLFEGARARCIAAAVAIGFSGLDTLGALLVRPATLWPFDIHIETWAPLQYSSMLTAAFWVPQHAMVGWLGGLLFLLWRRGFLPLHAFLGALPLCLLWSPLGVAGTLPFALLAVVEAAATRTLHWRDVAWPAAATALSLPSLAYLAADAGKVGARIVPQDPSIYLAFEIIEVLPALVLTATLGGTRSFGRASLVATAAWLAACPFVMIGENDDFTMRASIPAILILALTAADRLARSDDGPRRIALGLVLAIGALTPAREAYRAVIYQATPFPRCDVAAAWRESFSMFGTNTYFARTTALPVLLRSRDAATARPTTKPCYDHAWKVPRWSFVPPPQSVPGVIA